MTPPLPLPDEASARRQLDGLKRHLTEGFGPPWDGEDVVTLLKEWQFMVGPFEVGHRCCTYGDYPDLEVWVPMWDIIHTEKLKEVVELVDTLLSRLTADLEEDDNA